MGWTAIPAAYTTGHLVTAAQWNTFVFDNPAYLKGQASEDVIIEDDIVPIGSSQQIGKTTDPWAQGHFDALYASNAKYSVHKYVREDIYVWEPDRDHWDVTKANGGNGDYDDAGSGQMALKVLNNNPDSAYIGPLSEGAAGFPGQDESYNVSRNPYGCFPFALSHWNTDFRFWIGFRQTLGLAAPSAAAEKYAGLHYDGTSLRAECADGSSETQSDALDALSATTRYVLEILITSATSVLFYLNGVLLATLTGDLPTGDLDWTVLAISNDSAGALTFYLTVGRLLFQEDLS